MENTEPLGAVIARRRQALGLTQTQIESVARLPKTLMNRFERGSRRPSPTQLWRINVTFEALERTYREVDAIVASRVQAE